MGRLSLAAASAKGRFEEENAMRYQGLLFSSASDKGILDQKKPRSSVHRRIHG